MGRPKAAEAGAKERMRDAFWTLLERKSYDQITVSDVTRTSGLNRSAFYYHYGNIPELAEDAIAASYAEPEVNGFIANVLLGGHADRDAMAAFAQGLDLAKYRPSAHRLALIAGPHGSAGLAAQLKAHVVEVWLGILGVDRSDLDPGRRITLEFASSGILGIIAREDELFTPEGIGWIIRSGLPETVARLIASVKSTPDSQPSPEIKPSPQVKFPPQAKTAPQIRPISEVRLHPNGDGSTPRP